MEKLTGRNDEREILMKALSSSDPELIAVYRRRRVGKTFLIRSVFGERIIFHFTGVHEAGLAEQLENFGLTLQRVAGSSIPIATPTSWLQTFFSPSNTLHRKLLTGNQ